MATTGGPMGRGPQQLHVYVHWTEPGGWVFVPRPSDRPEDDPGLTVKAPARAPPPGTQGRCILLDCKFLNPMLDYAINGEAELVELRARLDAEYSRAENEKQRANRIQDELQRREEATRREIQLAGERLAAKFKENVSARRELESWEAQIKQAHAQLEAAADDIREQRARLLREVSQQREEESLKDEVRRLASDRATLEVERQRHADQVTCHLEQVACLAGDQAALEVERRHRAEQITRLARDRASLEAERQHHIDQVACLATKQADLESDRKCCADRVARLDADRAAFDAECQRHTEQVAADRMRNDGEQRRCSEEAVRCQAAQQELERAQEQHEERTTLVRLDLDRAQEELLRLREQRARDSEKLAREQEGLARERERFMQEQEERANELREKQKLLMQPERLFKSLLDGFAVSRPEAEFSNAQGHLLEDAKRIRDSSVFKDQLRLLDAVLVQKSNEDAQDAGSFRAEAADAISTASQSIVGALLAVQGLQEAGEKQLAVKLQEQLGFKASKALNLGATSNRGKASKSKEKPNLRLETPLAFAFALVSVCCLVWSSARRRIQGVVASVRTEIQEVRQLFPSQEKDLAKVQEKLKKVFAISGQTLSMKQDQTFVLETIQDLQARFARHSKSDCIGTLVEVSTKCYQAWETFEKHLVWQRKFARLCRHSEPVVGDFRALLLASFADPEEESTGLPRELAAIVRQNTCQRRQRRSKSMDKAHSAAGDAGGATRLCPSKRSRLHSTPSAEGGLMASPGSAHAAVSGSGVGSADTQLAPAN